MPVTQKKRNSKERQEVYRIPWQYTLFQTPVTEKKRHPKGRQDIHKIPWQCTLCQAWYAKTTEPQATPRRVSDPLPRHLVPCPIHKKRSPKNTNAYIIPLGNAHSPTPGTQKRRNPNGYQGVHQTPWQFILYHACYVKKAEPQGYTSDPLAMYLVPRMPRKSGGAPRNARAYIKCLGSIRCPTPVIQKRRTPKEHQGKHLTPW